jgi:clan AA aspartic protease (TIGR02281 family)
MSKTLRLSVIAVMLLSSTALGIIAYNNLYPPPPPPSVPEPTPGPPPMARPRVSRVPRIIEKLIPVEPAPAAPKPTLAQIAECIRNETARYQKQIHFSMLTDHVPNAAAGKQLHTDMIEAMRAAINDTCNGPSALPSGKSPQIASTTVPVDENGHRYPKVSINGRPVRMMVDSGASIVSLTEKDARKVGLNPQSLPMTKGQVTMDTANGPMPVTEFTLSEITVEGHILQNVSALCCTKSSVSLLGNSAVDQLDRGTQLRLK